MLIREMLASVMNFDPEKGRFFWLGCNKFQPKGKEVGSFDGHGYGQINVFGKVWKEHRLVWLWIHGELPDKQIDHINHDRRDNRPENLRLVDNVENYKNRPKQNNNKFGIPGISFDKRMWKYHAYITVDKKRITLGMFKHLEDAINSRLEANKKYGYHENHGSEFGRPKHKELKAMITSLGLNFVPGKLSMEQTREIYNMYQQKMKKEIANE